MRTLLIGLLLLLGAWFALGALDVLPGPLELLRHTRTSADSASLEREAAEAAGGGAALRGREGGPRVRPESGAAASTVPVIPAEVRGSVPRGAVVRGRVLRDAATRQPAPQVRVVLLRPNPVTAYLKVASEGRWDALEARTDAEGRFAFLDVRPAKGYVVRAGEAGRGVASSVRQDLGERQLLDVGELVLGVTGGLEGRVLDAAAAGIVDARVAVTWQVESILGMVLADPDTLPEREMEVRTDATGSFRIEGLEPGPKTVVIVAEGRGGRVLSTAKVSAGAVTRLPDVTLAGQGVVAGKVLWDDGKPVPGARVFAGEDNPGKPTLSTSVTGADGAFRIEHLDGASTRLGVFVPGIPVSPADPVPLGTLDVVLTLRAAGSVRGKVLEAAGGKPVTAFGVRLEPADEEHWLARAVRNLIDGGVGPQGVSSEDGRFRLPVVAHGAWRLVVSAPGYPEAKSAVVTVTAGEEADAGTIELAEGHRASGVVRLTDGSPLSQAHLHLLRVKPGQEPEAEVQWEWSEAPSDDALSDAEGRFEIPPQTPGRYALYTVHPYAAYGEPVTLDLVRGSQTGIEVRVAPAGRIHVLVQDPQGRPAPRERVWLIAADGWSDREHTDAEGRAEFVSVPAGRALLATEALALLPLLHRIGWGETPEAERRAAYDELARVVPEVLVLASKDLEHTLTGAARVEVTFRLPPALEEKEVWLLVRHTSTNVGRWLDRDDRRGGPVRLEPGAYKLSMYVEDEGTKELGSFVVPDASAHTVDVELPR